MRHNTRPHSNYPQLPEVAMMESCLTRYRVYRARRQGQKAWVQLWVDAEDITDTVASRWKAFVAAVERDAGLIPEREKP